MGEDVTDGNAASNAVLRGERQLVKAAGAEAGDGCAERRIKGDGGGGGRHDVAYGERWGGLAWFEMEDGVAGGDDADDCAVLGDEERAGGPFAHAGEGGGDAFVGRSDLKGVSRGDGDGVSKEGVVDGVGGQGEIDAGQRELTVRTQVDALGVGGAAFRAIHGLSSFALPDTGERYLGAYLFDDLVEGSDDEWLASLDG